MAVARTPPVVAFVTSEAYYWHDSGLDSYARWVQPRPSGESAESKRRFANLVAMAPALAGALTPLAPRPATDAEILRFHTPAYLQRVKDASAQVAGGVLGHELHVGPRGHDVAALSAGGVLAATEAVLAGAATRAYALVRPPGHHAEADGGMGFCIYSNVGLAAAHARARAARRASRLSTSTCTTATARRSSSMKTRPSCSSRCTRTACTRCTRAP